jgi:hypothetical protein
LPQPTPETTAIKGLRPGPHRAKTPGAWTTTAGGDWTGGFSAGMRWLAAKHTGEKNYHAHAAALAHGLKNRIAVDAVFKSFPLYFGAAPRLRVTVTGRLSRAQFLEFLRRNFSLFLLKCLLF